MVGMDPQSEENLHEAFMAVLTGDERPLLKMGMPQEEWFDVQFMLNRLIEGGLQVWRNDDVTINAIYYSKWSSEKNIL